MLICSTKNSDLRRLRTSNSISRKTASRLIGCTEMSLFRYETDRVIPRDWLQRKYDLFLDVLSKREDEANRQRQREAEEQAEREEAEHAKHHK